MEIKTSDKSLEIEVIYPSKGKFKRSAGQPRLSQYFKQLVKHGFISEPRIEFEGPEEIHFCIKCHDKGVYHHIIKGFQSVRGI